MYCSEKCPVCDSHLEKEVSQKIAYHQYYNYYCFAKDHETTLCFKEQKLTELHIRFCKPGEYIRVFALRGFLDGDLYTFLSGVEPDLFSCLGFLSIPHSIEEVDLLILQLQKFDVFS